MFYNITSWIPFLSVLSLMIDLFERHCGHEVRDVVCHVFHAFLKRDRGGRQERDPRVPPGHRHVPDGPGRLAGVPQPGAEEAPWGHGPGQRSLPVRGPGEAPPPHLRSMTCHDVCVPVWQSAPSVSLSVWQGCGETQPPHCLPSQSVCLSVCLSGSRPVSLSICLSICLFFCMSVILALCLSDCPDCPDCSVSLSFIPFLKGYGWPFSLGHF